MNVLVENSSLQDIADAIRAKNGTQTTYKPGEMADAIDAISGGITPTGTISITSNGTVDVTQYASANVAVPTGTTPTGTKTITITANGTTTEDVTNYASAEITVNVSGGGGAELKKHTGSFTPQADTRVMAVTGFEAPALAVIVSLHDYSTNALDGTKKALGALFVDGVVYRERTGTAGTSKTVDSYPDLTNITQGRTVYPDASPPSGNAFVATETGFCWSVNNDNYNFKAGYTYDYVCYTYPVSSN